MRVNGIEKNKVDITMDITELAMLMNILHDYEKMAVQASGGSGKDQDIVDYTKDVTFHEFAGLVVTAAELCLNGHLNNHAKECVTRHYYCVMHPKTAESQDI